jgi:hypothetical protein
MRRFAERTGLAADATSPTRYLWTDAFAVCNYLGLAARCGEEAFETLAVRLVDQVHRVLGRHREDDPRSGWISGLSEGEGARHPTLGGLRIGKPLAERSPGQPFDERQEWDRDGQYLHYLTRWMHALAQTSRATGDPRHLQQAFELARTAYSAFRHVGSDGRARLYWKMSIDLSRPLVASMGHHDPLDFLLTCIELRGAARRRGQDSGDPTGGDLREQITGLEEIARGVDWTTTDPLGLGGLLVDAYRLLQLVVRGATADVELVERLLGSGLVGLRALEGRGVWEPFAAPASERLAFRELGLSIGLECVDPMRRLLESEAGSLDRAGVLRSRLEQAATFCPIARRLEAFWLAEANQATASWRAHRDINSVMLATSLAPEGYIVL